MHPVGERRLPAGRIFLAAPYARESSAVIDDIVVPVLQRLEAEIVRVPPLPAHQAAPTIREHIRRCDLAVGVMTARNPNVFWELGVAYALGRPLVLLADPDIDLGLLAKAGQWVPHRQEQEPDETRLRLDRAVRGALREFHRSSITSLNHEPKDRQP